MAKVSKPTITKAHRIARAIKREGGKGNAYAIGMAQAKRGAAKRKRSRR